MEMTTIFKVGEYKGTPPELAKVVGIKPANMVKRLKKWVDGVYSPEKCMTIGPLSTKKPVDCGNDEWDSLSNKMKDAKQHTNNIKLNWNL